MEPTPESRAERSLVDVLTALSRGATRYENEGEFARGGMGSIHRVWDRELRRPLAMKVFLGDLDVERDASDSTIDPRVARFVEEAQITGQLDHPGIVPVHEIGLDEEGRLFFTMRLVKGHTLAEVFTLARDGADGWTERRVLRTFVRVCEAVAYAHSRGVVHRDLKPANIMVDEFGEVYVMDWGLAKVLGKEEPAAREGTPSVRSDRAESASISGDSHLLTLEGNVLGTPAYMPPEQARGRIQDVGPRSDVYALGAMLYEFLTGRMPYVPEDEEVSAYEILKAVLAEPPTPVRDIRPDAPGELVAICEKAMAREADERYTDSLQMADALSGFFERPVTQARQGLQRSRLVSVTQWILGLSFWTLCLALLAGCLMMLFVSENSATSVGVPIQFEFVDPSFAIDSNEPWVKDVELQDLTGVLAVSSNHWVARSLTVLLLSVVLIFMLFVIQQARQILRNVRRGEPFALENLRRMRRIGIAFFVLAALRTVQSPLMGLFAEKYLNTDGLVIRNGVQVPYMQFLGGAVVFILAEVFRVGAELEKREDPTD